jgi:hypothetical protein
VRRPFAVQGRVCWAVDRIAARGSHLDSRNDIAVRVDSGYSIRLERRDEFGRPSGSKTTAVGPAKAIALAARFGETA